MKKLTCCRNALLHECVALLGRAERGGERQQASVGQGLPGEPLEYCHLGGDEFWRFTGACPS